MHLHLVDAAQVELDGIFRGGEVLARLVQLGERRVERRRFARTGRARNEHHSEGLVDAFLEVVELALLEAELRHVELQVALVEETQNDLLTKECRQDGHTKVHLAALAHLQLNTTILGQAALGDIEFTHDLDARGERVLELERRLHDFVEHSINSVANAKVLLVGLDMNIRRGLLDGVGENQVDEFDDRGVFRIFRQTLGVFFFFTGNKVDAIIIEACHHVVEDVFLGLGVVGLDRFSDRVFRRDDRLNVVAGKKLNIVEGEDVRRIRSREDQGRPRAIDRDDAVLVGDVFRDQREHFRLDLKILEVDGRHAVLFGDELREFVLVHEAERSDLRAKALAHGRCFFAGLEQLL